METLLNLKNFFNSFNLEDLKNKKPFQLKEAEKNYLEQIFTKLTLKTKEGNERIVFFNEKNLSSSQNDILYIEFDEKDYIKEISCLPNYNKISVNKIIFNKNNDNDIFWRFIDFESYDNTTDKTSEVLNFIEENKLLIDKILQEIKKLESLMELIENSKDEEKEKVGLEINNKEELIYNLREDFNNIEKEFLINNNLYFNQDNHLKLHKDIKGIKKSGYFNKYVLLHNNYKLLNNSFSNDSLSDKLDIFGKETLNDYKEPLLIKTKNKIVIEKLFRTPEVDAICSYYDNGFIKEKERKDQSGYPNIMGWQPSKTFFSENGDILKEEWKRYNKQKDTFEDLLSLIQNFKKEKNIYNLDNLSKKDDIALKYILGLLDDKILHWGYLNDVDFMKLEDYEIRMLTDQYGL